jgi:hypothetical protein
MAFDTLKKLKPRFACQDKHPSRILVDIMSASPQYGYDPALRFRNDPSHPL